MPRGIFALVEEVFFCALCLALPWIASFLLFACKSELAYRLLVLSLFWFSLLFPIWLFCAALTELAVFPRALLCLACFVLNGLLYCQCARLTGHFVLLIEHIKVARPCSHLKSLGEEVGGAFFQGTLYPKAFPSRARLTLDAP
jgi:hypothetical protein